MHPIAILFSLAASLVISSNLQAQVSRPLKTEHKDSIAIFLQEQGVDAIEFFDSKLGLHMPVLSIISCGPRICSYEVIEVKRDSLTTKYEPSYDSELRKYSPKFRAYIPEYGRLIVSINTDSEIVNGKDVVGVTDAILSKYEIVPDTIEVSSLARDSIRIPTNRNWRLLRDSVEFRHLVNNRIMRFVRK